MHHPHRFPLPSIPTSLSSTHCCNHLCCSVHLKTERKKREEKEGCLSLLCALSLPSRNQCPTLLLPSSISHCRNPPAATANSLLHRSYSQLRSSTAVATHHWLLPSSLPSHLYHSHCLLCLFSSHTIVANRSTRCHHPLLLSAATSYFQLLPSLHLPPAAPPAGVHPCLSPLLLLLPPPSVPINPPPLLQPLLLPPLPLPPCHYPPTYSLDRQPLPSTLNRRPPLPSTSPSIHIVVVPSLLAASILNKKGTHLRYNHIKKKKKKKSTAATLLFPLSLAVAVVVTAFIATAMYSSVVATAFHYNAQPLLPIVPSATVQPLPLQQPLLCLPLLPSSSSIVA
ncbi:hypothetical protein BHM03_00059039 [Ensete ventricosum]|uniref:Uncharacterized protein n=1 Tax=Ensete ventricosum TaxID=4639 RepID=A0A445MMM2_ENSVE|nr:hypothetical protein BHM03_00059039 [Ensete ventricosum]